MQNILCSKLLARILAADVSQANHTVARLSGILDSQAALVIAKYKEHGWICEDRISIGDWTTITLALKL